MQPIHIFKGFTGFALKWLLRSVLFVFLVLLPLIVGCIPAFYTWCTGEVWILWFGLVSVPLGSALAGVLWDYVTKPKEEVL